MPTRREDKFTNGEQVWSGSQNKRNASIRSGKDGYCVFMAAPEQELAVYDLPWEQAYDYGVNWLTDGETPDGQ